MKAYHWLKADMTSGSGNEPPWIIGETRRVYGDCKLCERGYHSSPTPWDGLEYASGPMLCLVDVSTPVQSDSTKQVSRRRTLLQAVNVERDLRLLICRIAEDVLPIYEARFPGDRRPREAIEVTRRYVMGDATMRELIAAGIAARPAAGEAAWIAARVPAQVAWIAAGAARPAWEVAWVAAQVAWIAGEVAWANEALLAALAIWKEKDLENMPHNHSLPVRPRDSTRGSYHVRQGPPAKR